MCGIVGIIHKNTKDYNNSINLMNQTQNHRGPDGSGIKEYQNAILGHTRLSIVDINHGQQPMDCEDSKTSITFNGEIYGFLDIKKNLDYDFKTSSDTEVILALYKLYGIELFQKLKGMFAFGIWDDDKQSLLLGRDRFGEKPLYYAIGDNGEFIFASEIKAIISSKLFKPKISKKAIGSYLKHLYVDPLETIYENIYTLPPASYLTYRDGKIDIVKYFKYPNTQNIKLDEATDIFKNKFETAVQNQLIADVDVGAFLSGGLDSSTVVAVASKYKKDLKTFSFGFEGNMSELPYAREIAKRYGTQHHELLAKDVDIADMLFKMADVYDEPFADSSNIPTYLISKLAREHSKVILTGDGADELLGGYEWWYNPLLGVGNKESYFKEMMLKVLAKSFFKSYHSKAKQIKYGRKYSTVTQAHLDKTPNFTDNQINNLLNIESVQKNKNYDFKEENTVNDALKIDLQDYMPGDILVKIDRASMANSLELRAPFLDVDFASFCISLPATLKVTTQKDKLILRRAYENAWSESIKNRSKQGFGAPVDKWLKLPKVVALKENFFSKDKEVFEYLSFAESSQYFKKDNYQTWILLVLSIWFEKNKECI